MDNVKEVAEKAARQVDKGIGEAVSATTSTASGLLRTGTELWDTAKVWKALQGLRYHALRRAAAVYGHQEGRLSPALTPSTCIVLLQSECYD